MMAQDQERGRGCRVQLVALETGDGQDLNGALHLGGKATDTVVLVVPGKAKNFYSCVAGWLAPGLRQRGYDVLALNTRDHDSSTAETLEEAVLDLEAARRFCGSLGYRKTVIVGVSFGVNKVLHYLGGLGTKRGEEPSVAGVALLAAGGIQSYNLALWDRIQGEAAAIDAPLLIVQAEEDQFVQEPEKRAEEIAGAVASASKTWQTITGANHYFHGHGDEVVAATAVWLESLPR